jgi:hypothetical protein
MALTKDIKQYRIGSQVPTPGALKMGANASVYINSIALTDSNGYGKSAVTPTSNDICWGLWNGQVNSQPTTVSPMVAGTVSGNDIFGIDCGSFYLKNGTAGDAIAQSSLGKTCYVIDEQTVGATGNGNTRPVAGVVVDVPTSGQYSGLIGVAMGSNESSGSP